VIETAVSYVFKTPEGGWRVVGSRISLDSIIHGYWRGQTPEAIRQDFPTLTAEQVYGAIAFYLHNREEIDRYMKGQEELWEQLRLECEAKNKTLRDRIRASRAGVVNKDVVP
jgi:uncharacterized protein (DUF433 family)